MIAVTGEASVMKELRIEDEVVAVGIKRGAWPWSDIVMMRMYELKDYLRVVRNEQSREVEVR